MIRRSIARSRRCSRKASEPEMRKYLKILRISLVERLAYRADFFLTTFFRFLPLITTFLLWEAIYAGANTEQDPDFEIAGFREKTMIAYLLLVQISRMFSSMPGLSIGISGFWFMEVTSLMYIINIINYFVSGQMFPLDLLRQYPYVTTVLELLPFQYLAYFPAMVFLEKKTGADLALGLAIEASWAL